MNRRKNAVDFATIILKEYNKGLRDKAKTQFEFAPMDTAKLIAFVSTEDYLNRILDNEVLTDEEKQLQEEYSKEINEFYDIFGRKDSSIKGSFDEDSYDDVLKANESLLKFFDEEVKPIVEKQVVFSQSDILFLSSYLKNAKYLCDMFEKHYRQTYEYSYYDLIDSQEKLYDLLYAEKDISSESFEENQAE